MLIAEESPHREPWWKCYGCWKIIALSILGAVYVGCLLRACGA